MLKTGQRNNANDIFFILKVLCLSTIFNSRYTIVEHIDSLAMQNLERIKQQWAKELPDLDTSTMELWSFTGLYKHMTSAMSETFRRLV